jgi:hypothetical protein
MKVIKKFNYLVILKEIKLKKETSINLLVHFKPIKDNPNHSTAMSFKNLFRSQSSNQMSGEEEIFEKPKKRKPTSYMRLFLRCS